MAQCVQNCDIIWELSYPSLGKQEEVPSLVTSRMLIVTSLAPSTTPPGTRGKGSKKRGGEKGGEGRRDFSLFIFLSHLLPCLSVCTPMGVNPPCMHTIKMDLATEFQCANTLREPFLVHYHPT